MRRCQERLPAVKSSSSNNSNIGTAKAPAANTTAKAPAANTTAKAPTTNGSNKSVTYVGI
ncbi:MAG: hypothetical protein M3Y53_01640 [Thermoproteota archaeon]|nr:hypothetical protein [Thermoproteota archaeon]